MPLPMASITGPLVDLATSLIGSLGLAGVGLLMVTSGVIGVPGTEPTMLFAGFNVFQGHLSLAGVIIAGTVGDTAGAVIAFAVGYYGRRELLERQSSKLHVNPSGLDRANRWFEHWGAPAIFVSRLLPFVRAAFPFAAGVAEMPFWRFLPLATLGSLAWVSALGILGREVGSQWVSWRHHLEYVDYAGAVVLAAAVAYLIMRWMRARSRPEDREAEPAADVVPD